MSSSHRKQRTMLALGLLLSLVACDFRCCSASYLLPAAQELSNAGLNVDVRQAAPPLRFSSYRIRSLLDALLGTKTLRQTNPAADYPIIRLGRKYPLDNSQDYANRMQEANSRMAELDGEQLDLSHRKRSKLNSGCYYNAITCL